MGRYVSAQLDALRAREVRLELEREILVAQQDATSALVASEQRRADALVRAAYRSSRESPLERILSRGSLVAGIAHAVTFSHIGDDQRRLVERLRGLRRELESQRARLEQDADDLARLREAMSAKSDALELLRARVSRITEAQRRGGHAARLATELEILRELAAAEERASAELQDVVKRVAPFLPDRTGTWKWPTLGTVTQPFGPTSLALEPPLVYEGVSYLHFHAALDIATPLYYPIHAAAEGRVSFVGHFSDGSMVVVISHGDGYVSLYAHLDDGAHAPLVRVGDAVSAGDPLGAVGLTGVSTGPHLHFAVLRGSTPVDPRTLLPVR